MVSLPPFDAPGDWFKGNLHTHTTQSDGRATPAENMQWHADHGYHFVALTDHNRVTNAAQFMPQPPLLTIPGAELYARRGDVEYHIVALGIQDVPIAHNSDAQAAIDAVNAAGGLCFIAHPYWNDLLPDDLLALRGHIGFEIFNNGCWLEIAKGHALVHWDAVLRRGQRSWGLASDDSHWKDPDYGGGWVMARAPRLDAPSIVQAIRQGQFYATQGPEIYDVHIEGRQVTVRCSPARSIYVIGNIYHCPDAAQAWDDTPLTQATFTLRAQQHYLRVEVVDMQRRSAWTNAYFI